MGGKHGHGAKYLHMDGTEYHRVYDFIVVHMNIGISAAQKANS